jgi:F-type H+-transporting ATPase subunit b
MEIVSTIGLITINATLLHQLVAFLIFMFIMNRIMFRPLRSVMGERESFMEKIKVDTADAAKEFERLTDELSARESKIRTEAHEVRQGLEASGSREAADILDATRQEIEAFKEKTELEINIQISEARTHLQKQSEALAVDIMEKLLDRRLVR